MHFAKLVSGLIVGTVLIVGAGLAEAQTPPPPPAYGAPISFEQAKKALAGAEAEAKKHNWPVVIAILDTGGNTVLIGRLDNAQFGSIEVARQKAYTAVAFRRPSKVFEDAVAGGGAGLRILKLEGASPLEGGLPIIVDGKVIGAIGVSGVLSTQDAQIGRAGIDALSK
jgi:uncharacterized protein GlcG (DUF336 family)